MPLIKISADELERLARDARRKRDEVDEVCQVAASAVNTVEWRSAAMDSFKDLWNRHKKTLNDLEHDLMEWGRHCDSQVPVARAVNQPF